MALDEELVSLPELTEEDAKAEHRRILVIIGALMLGIGLASLDQTIVATALPTIAGDLHALNHLSWVVVAYLLTLCISTPQWGKLGDLYGRKKLFQAAIVIFLIGSMLAGLSQTMIQLVAFRALQGVGAGGLMVGAQAILGDVVSPRQRGRYMGYFGAVFGITNVAGPLLGGFFTQHLSWRWIFYINVPLGILAMFVIGRVLKIPVHRKEHQLDYLGSALLGVAVTLVILLTDWGGTTYAWGSPVIIGMGVVAVVLLTAFVLLEQRVSEPVMPISLFHNRVFSVTSVIGFIVGFIMFGAIIYIPLYLQTAHGASPTSAGLQLLPLVAGMLATFIPSGRLVTRWGRYKIFPVAGTAIMALGLYLLSLLTPTTTLGVSSIYMVVTGLGLGMVMQVLVVAAQNSVPYEMLGVATSTATFFRTIGGAFGVALFGAIFSNRLYADLKAFLPAQAWKQIQGKNISANPAQLKQLPAPIHAGYVQAFSHSLDTVFRIGVVFCLVGFVLSLFLKEVPLRDRAFVSTGEAAAEGAAMAPTFEV